MAIPIKHYGVYRFVNYGYNNGQALNAYGSSSIPLQDMSNVMLFTKENNDTAQQWRAMYAGVDGEKTLYWLNCEMGGQKDPYALDRLMSRLKNNADVYRAWKSSAADQLVYFTEIDEKRIYIHLYGVNATDNNLSDLVLTAAPNSAGTNGNNSPSSLTQAGNVYWSVKSSSTAQQWTVEQVSPGADPDFSDMVTKFPAGYYYTHSGNAYYPNNVGECTWYCCGRFYEVNKVAVSLNPCNAAEWVNNYNTKSCYCDMTLSGGSVAVFGANASAKLGHVVFVENVDTEENIVTYSECNYGYAGDTVALSNGEIEVPNSRFTAGNDGVLNYESIEKFKRRYGSGLIGVIHKR